MPESSAHAPLQRFDPSVVTNSADWISSLRQARWLWPKSGAQSRGAWLGFKPPALRPGQVVLVTVDGYGAALWALGVGTGDGVTGTFGPEASKVWHDAAVALPRSLPFLWQSVREAEARIGDARLLRMVPRIGGGGQCLRVLDGRSFGLAFLLALASRVTNRSISDHVAALAEIAPSGVVGPVDALEDKLLAIADVAPRVRRVLVADEQVEFARAIVARHQLGLDIVGVKHGATALNLAFDRKIGTHLADLGRDAGSREEIANSLLRLAIQGRQAMTEWEPVAQAAGRALAWPKVERDQRWRLEFARAVALRHSANSGLLPRLTVGTLSRFHAPVRVEIVANYVQQAADTGVPSVGQIEALVRRYLPREHEAHAEHVHVMGALARLYANRGRFREALRLQERAAGVLFGVFESEQTSYALSEWYRLAGGLGDRPAFARADRLYAQVERGGGLGDGRPYVELARCRALVAFGRGAECVEALSELAGPSGIEHVRGSAARYLIRVIEKTRPQDLQGWVESLATLPPYACLVGLDSAVRTGDARAAQLRLAQLLREDPGPMRQLQRVAPRDPLGKAEFVARFYPY